jgi:signal transduction histidine kinase
MIARTSPFRVLLRQAAAWPKEIREQRPIRILWVEDAPRQIFIALLVAIGYYLGARLGFALKPLGSPIATFWPPNAILLAAFLLAPLRTWWILLLAIFPAHLLIQFPSGVPLVTACGWFLSNSAEALVGAACIRRLKKPEELFESVSGVLVYLAFAVILAPLATSFVDAAVVITTGFGKNYWALWVARLFSNMLADLTVAPAIIVLALNSRRFFQHLTRARIIEVVLLGSGVLLVSSFVFRIAIPTIPALMFSPLPLLLWIAVRFGATGLYPSLLSIALISIWNATRGRDPFIFAPMEESIRGVQIFLSTIALPMMLLVAVLAERNRVSESLRQSRGRLIDAQEQERRRIARELHDDIGQQLTVLELELDQLRRQPGQSLKPQLDKLYFQASTTSAATRALSHGLHSSHLEILGLVPAVRNLCQTVSQETNIEVTFAQENVPARLDPQITLCIYRVTQEALHNVARHSQAHKASVTLRHSEQQILLDIIDDGVGITGEREQPVALGLASMQERVSLLRGTFKISSQPMHGTRIQAAIPLAVMQ